VAATILLAEAMVANSPRVLEAMIPLLGASNPAEATAAINPAALAEEVIVLTVVSNPVELAIVARDWISARQGAAAETVGFREAKEEGHLAMEAAKGAKEEGRLAMEVAKGMILMVIRGRVVAPQKIRSWAKLKA